MNTQTSSKNSESRKLPQLSGVNNDIDSLTRRVRNNSGRSDDKLLLREHRNQNVESRFIMRSRPFNHGNQMVEERHEMLNKQEADYNESRSKALVTNRRTDAFMLSERGRLWNATMKTSEYSQEMMERTNRTERELQQRIIELQKECDDLRTRLSAAFGAKLHFNNPNIVDLSDTNRPTKLAERFSELYDNEWTNAFEVLRKQLGSTEQETVQRLLQVCVTIYRQCRNTSAKDLQDLTRAIQIFSPEQTVYTVKRLIECRKQRYLADTKSIGKTLETIISTVFQISINEPYVKSYWTQCLEICWLMVIQDPPVVMDTRTDRKGDLFDASMFRPYTKSGKYIEYIVWPTVYLTAKGPILYKGVAQGTNVR